MLIEKLKSQIFKIVNEKLGTNLNKRLQIKYPKFFRFKLWDQRKTVNLSMNKNIVFYKDSFSVGVQGNISNPGVENVDICPHENFRMMPDFENILETSNSEVVIMFGECTLLSYINSIDEESFDIRTKSKDIEFLNMKLAWDNEKTILKITEEYMELTSWIQIRAVIQSSDYLANAIAQISVQIVKDDSCTFIVKGELKKVDFQEI